jgi:hypothetical protein
MRWLLTAALLVGCADEKKGKGDGLAPEFKLEDVNATSATFGQKVGPRDYMGEASAWYFGHST